MTYTRRSLLRDAALVSTATAMVPSSLLADGSITAFNSGVRVFFSGAWLFCADPTDNTMMRAVTVNPCESGAKHLGHHFPYGQWDQNKLWDKRHPGLSAAIAKPDGSDVKRPHQVQVEKEWSKKPSTVKDLFSNANRDSKFLHLPPKKDAPYSIDWTHGGLRVISLPMPSCIIPGAFRTASTIDDTFKHLEPSASTVDKGYATTHIFNYEGASSLTFTPANGARKITLTGSAGYSADFHCHTIPDSAIHDAAGMFSALFDLINGLEKNGLKFHPGGMQERITRGSLVPDSVSYAELEMSAPKSRQNFNGYLGACCSPGGGVG